MTGTQARAVCYTFVKSLSRESKAMKGILLSVCMLLLSAGNSFAADIVVPAGTRMEGATMFGTFAPAETATAQNFSLAVIITANPVVNNGKELPLKDCVILGDVVADVTVSRAFFRAVRIACPNAKENSGTLLKGYAVDDKDSKLGIQGVAGGPPNQQRYVEIPPETKVTIYILDGIIIALK